MPDAHIERKGVPVDIDHDDDTVTVSTGSYGSRPGMEITLHLDYVAELIDEQIEMDNEVLLDMAISQAIGRLRVPDNVE